MTDTPQILLAHHLKALKLPTFLREYDKVARLCAAEGVDHPRYLMRLAEMEMPGGHRPPIVDFCAPLRAGANGAWSSAGSRPPGSPR
jgi:hypothetical protein